QIDVARRGRLHGRRVRGPARLSLEAGRENRDGRAIAERLRHQASRERASDDVSVADDEDGSRGRQGGGQSGGVSSDPLHPPPLDRVLDLAPDVRECRSNRRPEEGRQVYSWRRRDALADDIAVEIAERLTILLVRKPRLDRRSAA